MLGLWDSGSGETSVRVEGSRHVPGGEERCMG